MNMVLLHSTQLVPIFSVVSVATNEVVGSVDGPKRYGLGLRPGCVGATGCGLRVVILHNFELRTAGSCGVGARG
jgi:hypothetical protein